MAYAVAQDQAAQDSMVKERAVVKVVSPCLEIKIVDRSWAPFLRVEFGSGSRVWIVVD